MVTKPLSHLSFNDTGNLTRDFIVQALIISMSGMIHMQIQTGMGRHRAWSEERPHLFRLSMKVKMCDYSIQIETCNADENKI